MKLITRRTLIATLASVSVLWFWLEARFEGDEGLVGAWLRGGRLRVHPVRRLLDRAAQIHAERNSSRPAHIGEAYVGYLRAHSGRLPPPQFDTWFKLASELDICNLDRYDKLRKALLPWWGMDPAELRYRQGQLKGRESAGRVSARHGKVIPWKMQKGADRGADSEPRRTVEDILLELQERYSVRIPDFDLWVNGLDEPRIVASWEEVNELTQLGEKRQVRRWTKNVTLNFHDYSQSSRRAFDIIRRVCPNQSLTRQATLDSSAGISPEVSSHFAKPFTTLPGEFLSDPEKELDWCSQPDLQNLHSFFIRPLTLSYSEELFPIFGNSKIEGFNDILIPSWWHWTGKPQYNWDHDLDWNYKIDKLYWRGTSTGGFSHGLEWQGWLRCRFVSRLNRPQEWNHFDTTLLAHKAVFSSKTTPFYFLHKYDEKTELAFEASLPSHLMNFALADVAFSDTDQHGEADSLASQRREPSFRFLDGPAPFKETYRYKLVGDLDGTAYSGRFWTLMKSNSAVLKSRLFQEAMDETLIPWYHYIPLSLRLREIYNILLYFFGSRDVLSATMDGSEVPARVWKLALGSKPHDGELLSIAKNGKEWGKVCTRKEDVMLYTYRVVLEWARLQRDDRERLGFQWDFES